MKVLVALAQDRHICGCSQLEDVDSASTDDGGLSSSLPFFVEEDAFCCLSDGLATDAEGGGGLAGRVKNLRLLSVKAGSYGGGYCVVVNF